MIRYGQVDTLRLYLWRVVRYGQVDTLRLSICGELSGMVGRYIKIVYFWRVISLVHISSV